MVLEHFTPGSALLGGVLIGLSASALMLTKGRVLGISGIVGSLLWPTDDPAHPTDGSWRITFVAGLLAGGALLLALAPAQMAGPSTRPLVAVGLAGLLVGIGTQMGNGCTSGHGVCGLTRGSPRSLAAVITFMTTGVLAATVAPWVWGGP